MADVARGVSTVLGYSLNLVVATLVVTGVLVAAGSLVDSQREQAMRAEMTVIGERITANLETADRLARRTETGTVVVESDLPRRIAGSTYSIRIRTEAGNASTVVTLDSSSIKVTIPINNESVVVESRHTGGTLSIRERDSGALVVTDD
ncbi:MAG: hypothetical protein ABEJ44_03270 [Halanaeroarchaeum sp.]